MPIRIFSASFKFWKFWSHNIKAMAKDKKVNIAVTYMLPIYIYIERERETGRQTERERVRERETERESERESERETERARQRERVRERE
jgi:hypothetical protein